MQNYRRFALITVVAVYFLILVGGIVRATGAGMGCPDWPKCFGQWVPPTAEDQLPADYQERYAEHGYAEDRFNVAKTWTEYVNRLIGVVIGFLIFGTLVLSRHFWKSDRRIVWWSLVAFLLVGFQGWLGALVVDSNLAVWMVTLHMVVALVIVGILIYAWTRSERDIWAGSMRPLPWATPLFVGALIVSMLQVVGGTQVREHVDEVAKAGVERGDWVEQIGWMLKVHRTESLLTFAVCAWLVWRVWKLAAPGGAQRTMGALLLGVFGAEIVTGAFMYYFAIPAFLQPVHLLLASVGVGVLFALWMSVRYGSRAAT